MTLQELDNRLVALRDSVVNRGHILGREIELASTIAIGEEMALTGAGSVMNDPATVRKKTNSKLLVRSGKLYRSFIGGQDSLTKTKVTSSGISTVIGSKLIYSTIQNYGGVVKATPVTVQRKTRNGSYTKQTYKMAQFFWAMFRKTKNTYWQSLALHVEQEGSITIKPTNYFVNAMKKFEKRYAFVVSSWLADAIKKG